MIKGFKIPKVIFRVREGDTSDDETICAIGGKWIDKSTDDYFKSKRVILFSLPGAFTPTCSSQQLPGFEKNAHKIKDLGIDEIYCCSVNDSYVMNAWAKKMNISNIKVIPDGSGLFTKYMGMLISKDHDGFGQRSWRYMAIINDGIVEKWWQEPGINNSGSDSSIEIEDLIQIGYYGLVTAAQNYTLREGATFASYAGIRIRGAIVDHLRKSSNLCRTTIQMQKKANAAEQKLQARHNRKPNVEEIATEMEIAPEALMEWQQAFQANVHQSLDSVYDEFSIWYESPENTPEDNLNDEELRDMLKDALRTLSEREGLVIQLYFVEELNVYEIAEILEVTTGRVSQIKSAAVARLRNYLRDQDKMLLAE